MPMIAVSVILRQTPIKAARQKRISVGVHVYFCLFPSERGSHFANAQDVQTKPTWEDGTLPRCKLLLIICMLPM